MDTTQQPDPKGLRKIDSGDLAVLIPVRIDSDERRQNLAATLTYLETFYQEPEVIVWENAPVAQCDALTTGRAGVRHIFEKFDGERFHRTRILNEAAKRTDRRFICAYDADVILHPDAALKALTALRRMDLAMVVPYNGIVLDIGGQTRQRFLEAFDFSLLPNPSQASVGAEYADTATCLHVTALGGAPFFERRRFLRYGGYNRKMMSYGWEDTEIANRFMLLGNHVPRVSDHALYHLHHARGVNSSPTNQFYEANRQELLKVLAMDKTRLVDYIRTELHDAAE